MFSKKLAVSLSLLMVIAASQVFAAKAQEATPPAGSDPPVLWRSNPGLNYGLYDRPASVLGDMLYILEADGTLRARSIADGSSLWSVSTGLTGGLIEVTAGAGVVAVVRGGEMRVFQATDGEELWTRTVSNADDVFPPAVFYNNVLLTNELKDDITLPHSTGTIYGLNPLDGTEVWTPRVAAGGLDSYKMPIVDGVVFVSLSDGHVEAIDAVSGALIWQTAASTTGYDAPIVVGGFVLAQGRNARGAPTITVLNRTDGSLAWAHDPSGYLEGVVGRNVIVTSSSTFDRIGASVSTVQSFELATGVERWRIGNMSVTTLAADEDMGFLSLMTTGPGVPSSSVLAFDEATGDQVWTRSFSEPSFDMTPCDEKLIVRHGPLTAWMNQSDGRVAYDFVVGDAATQAMCLDGSLAATIGSDGVVAVHDTTVTPNLLPGIPFDFTIPQPFFRTLPISAPEGEPVAMGVWRGEIGQDGWIELPAEISGLNLYVESGSVVVLEALESDNSDAPVVRVGEGGVIAVPDGGTAVRSDDGSVARVYVAGILSQSTAAAIGENTLPGFEAVALAELENPPTDDVLIEVTQISPDVGTGIWPRLSAGPSLVQTTDDAIQVPTAPGVRDRDAQTASEEEVPPDLIFSITGAETAPVQAVLVSYVPTGSGILQVGCAYRCIVR